MNLADLTDKQERAFAAHLFDMAELAAQKHVTRFTGFLDMRREQIARQVMRDAGCDNFMFYAGHAQGERCMLGVFAPYEQPDPNAFPIEGFALRFRKEDALGHRDVLGSLTALEIKREAVGDILIGEGLAVFFVTAAAAPVVAQEITKIGRTGVQLSQELPDELPALHKFREMHLTVSSLRLDCVVAAMAGISREKAAQTVRSQLVSVNGAVVDNVAKMIVQQDVLSIRGQGKFLFAQQIGMSKKGRLHILCKKYT